MGAKQSKRSVDITTTPKKGESEAVVEGEGKVEKIGDVDPKLSMTNGTAHSEIEYADKDETTKDESGEKVGEVDVINVSPIKEEIKENGISESTEEPKTPLSESRFNEQETMVISTPVDKSDAAKTPENGDTSTTSNNKTVEETPENKKNKEKRKKMKWSFRSISFSKKDKSKPNKDADKNGEVKEVTEENAEETATSPSVESPKTDEPKTPESPAAAPVTNGNASADELTKPEVKEEKPAAAAVAAPVAVAKEEPAAQPVKEEPPVAVVKEEPAAVVVKKEEPVVEATPVVVAASSPVVEEAPMKVEEPPKPVEIPPVVEETKEVRSEEVPPPLPSSNPPSPVTVFAESTKADALPADQVPQPEQPPITPQQEIVVPEPAAAQAAAVVVESEPAKVEEAVVVPPAEPVPVEEEAAAKDPTVPADCSNDLEVQQQPIPELPKSPAASPEPASEPLIAAAAAVVAPTTDLIQNVNDSLPDISTESLPSMPEPLSESLPEPMSLPPVESVPEPIICELTNGGTTEPNLPSPPPPPTAETNGLTNGTNGLPSSPISTNDDVIPPAAVVVDAVATKDGPLKQVPEVISAAAPEEVRQEEKVEESAPEAATVEE